MKLRHQLGRRDACLNRAAERPLKTSSSNSMRCKRAVGLTAWYPTARIKAPPDRRAWIAPAAVVLAPALALAL
jgi:hypothetical protein